MKLNFVEDIPFVFMEHSKVNNFFWPMNTNRIFWRREKFLAYL